MINKNKEEIEKIEKEIKSVPKQGERIYFGNIERRKERIKTSILWCEAIEDKLDKLNGEKGNLCLYCDAKEYDGKIGIIHKDNCLILQLRTHLNWLKEQEKE